MADRSTTTSRRAVITALAAPTALAGVLTGVACNQAEAKIGTDASDGQHRDLHNPTPQYWGAKGDGVTNDTSALLAFFNQCIANGVPGHIPAGRYLVNAGALVFDTGFIDKAWPQITTDGYEAVTFLFADAVNAPMITLSNGTASGPSGRYWQGGGLGGFTVADAVPVGGDGIARHALSLVGVYGTHFGWVRANGTAGDAIHCPQKHHEGINPDPYAVTYCTFDGAEANRTKGRAFTNLNGPGLNFCRIKSIRAVETGMGGLYGLGASNHFEFISAGSHTGWAVYDGNEGTIDRCLITDLELDNPQYGVRINSATFVTIRRCRTIARSNAHPNTTRAFWPLTAFEIAASGGGGVRHLVLDNIFRLDAPGVLANVGKFFDFNNSASIVNATITVTVMDNAELGITDAAMLSHFNANSSARIVRDGREIVNTLTRADSGASFKSALAVPNAGWATPKAILAFDDVRYDAGGAYSATGYGFTAPRSGRFLVTIALPLTLPERTRVRIGVWLVRGGVGRLAARRDRYQLVTAMESHELHQVIDAAAGDVLYAMADQNSASPANVTPMSIAEGEALFQVTPL